MRKAIITIGVATSCALAAGACSQNGGAQQAQRSPQQVVTSAYSHTTNAKTAKITLTTDATIRGKTTHATGAGVIQFDPATLDLTTHAAGQSTEVRVLGGITYLRTGGGKWTKIDTSKLTGNSTMNSSPDQMLSYLHGALDSVTSTGPATINGAHTTGYKATVDLDKVAAKQKTPQAKQAIHGVEKATGSKTLPVQVWIDNQGRIAREQNSSTVTTQGHRITTTITLDLTDYGTPVHVTAPHGII
ncbi:MAG: LppX_LprAFG lipoprotein [Sciscionella sp.]